MSTQSFSFKHAIGWTDSMKQVMAGNPYLAAEIADSRDRHLEEFLRKHVVTTSNAAGDIIVGTGQAIESANFVTGVSGWQIDGSGNVEFESGTFRGTFEGGEIHVPDRDTTANSFHVDDEGNLWIGATETNKATAPFQVGKSGIVRAGSSTNYLEMLGAAGRIDFIPGASSIDAANIRALISTEQRLSLTSGTNTGYTNEAYINLVAAAASADTAVQLDNLYVNGTLTVDGAHIEGNWTTFTPSITQDATDATDLTFSANNSRWRRVGDKVEVFVSVTFSSAGTASNVIKMVLPDDLTDHVSLVGGTVLFRDTGAAHHCFVEGVSLGNDLVRFTKDDPSGNGILGTTISYTVASGDTLEGHIVFNSNP